MISFGVYFFTLLLQDSQTPELQQFHVNYFFDLIPTDTGSIRQNLHIIESLFGLALDKTFISLVWSIPMYILGCIILIRKDLFAGILLILPVLLTIGASHFHFYSLIERLSLFFIPLLMIVIGIGISNIWKSSNRLFLVLAYVLLFVSIVNKNGYKYIYRKLEIEDSKSVLVFISDHRKSEDLLYVHYDGIPAFIFYNHMHDRAYDFDNYYLAEWDDLPAVAISEQLHSISFNSFWLFFSHTFPQENIDNQLASAMEVAEEIERFMATEASVYHFRIER